MTHTRTLLAIVLLLGCSSRSTAQSDSLYYHDMQMESQWGSTTANDLFGCFVRFTPPVYPVKLTGIRAYFRNSGNPSTFKWKVYTDPSGSAVGGLNYVYLSPVPLTNPAAGGVANQDYTDYVDLTSSNINILAGDFYAGVVQNNGYFGVGIDNLPNSSVAPTRQWQWMNVFGTDYWNTLSSQASSGQFGITAFYQPIGTSLPETDQHVQIVYRSDEKTIDVFLTNPEKGALVKLLDVSGRLTSTSMCTGNTCSLDLNAFDSGIYTLVVYSGKGITTRKFGVY